MKETKKIRAHTVYKNPEGKRIPSVTTIIGLLNKPALVRWANKLGLEGIDSTKYVDLLAEVGTLTHKMVECDCDCGVEINFDEYSKDQIDKANIAYSKWEKWKKENKFEPIENEIRLVGKYCKNVNSSVYSNQFYYFGGTADIYCKLNGKRTLLDLKTSKACYIDQHIQVASYKELLEQNNYIVDDARILRIGREENEGFQDIEIHNIETCQKIFMNLLEIYYLKKEIKI